MARKKEVTKKRSISKAAHLSIQEVLDFLPRFNPDPNPLIATGPYTAKLQNTFKITTSKTGLDALGRAEWQADALALKLVVLIKQIIVIGFSYEELDKETGEIEIKQGLVKKVPQRMFIQGVR